MNTKTTSTESPVTYLGITALVEATGANGKDIRRWLRSATKAVGAGDTLPGKGGRYAFTPDQVDALAAAYRAGKARQGSNAAATALTAALAPTAG